MDLYIDVETSGLDPKKYDVIEIAMLAVRDHEIVDSFFSKVRPSAMDYNWCSRAEKIHKMTYREVGMHPPSKEVCLKIINFIERHAPFEYRIYHALNVKGYFDEKHMRRLFINNDLIYEYEDLFKNTPIESTITLAKSLGFKKNSLDVWADRVGFNLDHHSARSDIECTVEVHKYLKNYNPDVYVKKQGELI